MWVLHFIAIIFPLIIQKGRSYYKFLKMFQNSFHQTSCSFVWGLPFSIALCLCRFEHLKNNPNTAKHLLPEHTINSSIIVH